MTTQPPPPKEQAPCCVARALPDGRPVIGYYSPECIRRPENWAREQAAQRRLAQLGLQMATEAHVVLSLHRPRFDVVVSP